MTSIASVTRSTVGFYRRNEKRGDRKSRAALACSHFRLLHRQVPKDLNCKLTHQYPRTRYLNNIFMLLFLQSIEIYYWVCHP